MSCIVLFILLCNQPLLFTQETHTDDIWNNQPIVSNAKVAFLGETHELGLGPKWAEEYLEHSIDHPDATAAKSENPDFAYSKFMKFMRQEGDLPIETAAATVSNIEKLDSKWTSEFTETESTKPLETVSGESKEADTKVLSAIDEQSAVAGSWINEFTKNNPTNQGNGYKHSH